MAAAQEVKLTDYLGTMQSRIDALCDVSNWTIGWKLQLKF